MSPTVVLFILLCCGLASAVPVEKSPKTGKTFVFDGLTKGFTISRVTNEENQVQQTTNGYQVRFVPLITLLAGMLPNLMTRLGQFTGVNRITTNNRRFGVAEKLQENSITAPPHHSDDDEDEDEDEEDENEDYLEKELIECDGHHLGLWPDRTDSQRYYKCEVDPRTSPSASCIKEMVGQTSGKEMKPLEKIEVPGVKPCYLLSMLKCANGFKYQHSTRICVPDIIYVSKHH